MFFLHYPFQEDKLNRKLLYQCRNCDYKAVAERPCIYGNLLKNKNQTIMIF